MKISVNPSFFCWIKNIHLAAPLECFLRSWLSHTLACCFRLSVNLWTGCHWGRKKILERSKKKKIWRAKRFSPRSSHSASSHQTQPRACSRASWTFRRIMESNTCQVQPVIFSLQTNCFCASNALQRSIVSVPDLFTWNQNSLKNKILFIQHGKMSWYLLGVIKARGTLTFKKNF